MMKPDVFRELLIGCGSRIHKDLASDPKDSSFRNVTTLDINPDHKPDVVHDLREHPLPFDNNTFDEIHAYEVLEHLAYQGDYEYFFAEWNEYWRILKPNGLFFGTVPARNSIWAWGDPSHKRIISAENFIFLSQDEYEAQVGATAISDFRYLYHGHFDVEFSKITPAGQFLFVLKAGRKILM